MSVSHPLPVLMRDAEVISLKEACFRTGRSAKTIRRWCLKDGIGRRSEPTAPWEISAVALEAKRYGDETAIEELRRGNFAAYNVQRYAEFLGLQLECLPEIRTSENRGVKKNCR